MTEAKLNFGPAGRLEATNNENLGCHWCSISNLPKILARGFYSRSFARRIRDWDYRPRNTYSDPDYVWQTSPDRLYFDLKGTETSVVGIVTRRERKTFFRVAPRNFVGLVVPDISLSDLSLRELIAKVREARDNSGEDFILDLPISGISGKLYYPGLHTEVEKDSVQKAKEK